MNPKNSLQQTGAVLIVALMLLVVLTLLGMSAIESTKLETKMALNVRYHNLAFQNAEAGIARTFQYYQQLIQSSPDQLSAELRNINSGAGGNNFTVVPISGNIAQGQYQVRILNGGSKNSSKDSRGVSMYFIESQGTAFQTEVKLYAGMTIDGPRVED